jgi:Dolichyl-phosphate-mannose-protein mannosyltransferase
MIRFSTIPLKQLLLWMLLLASGLAVRCIGIRHGEADRMVYHPDVAKQSLVAQYAYQGDCNIRKIYRDDFHEALYPYGTSVMLGHTARVISQLSGNPPLHRAHRFYWALWLRYLSVAFILIGTVFLLRTLRRQLGSATAFLTGLLLLFEPLNVQYSHYGMNDVPLLALLFLGFSAALAMPRDRKIPIFSLLAGLAAGIACAIKYQGLLGLIFPGIFWLALRREKGPRWSLVSALAVAAGFFLGSLPLSPLLVRDPSYFFSTFPTFMEWQAHIMGEAIPFSIKLRTNLVALIQISFRQGHFLLWIAGGWAGVEAIRRRMDIRFAAPVFSLLLFCGLMLLAMLFSRDMVRENDLMPIFALLIVAAAYPTASLLNRPSPRWQRLLLLVPALVLTVMFITISLLDSLALIRLDTRMRARQWCDENLLPNAVVVTEMYSLPPTRPDLRCFRAKYLSDPLPQQSIRSNRVQYLVTSSLASSRYADRGSPFYSQEVQETYQSLFENCTLQATFRDRPLLLAHPDIAIYEWTGFEP